MTSAAALIDALNARVEGGRLRQAARDSWTQWLDRLAQKPGRVTGAPADDLVGLMLAREPALPPRRVDALGRWQAFATLWRQHWQPASRDERRWRWTAGGVSFGWHVLVAVLLLIVTALRPTLVPPADDDAVQVEYIGRGTPAEPGGGPAPSPAQATADESPAAAAARGASPAAPAALATTTAAATQTPPDEAQASTPPQPVQLSTPVSQEPPTFVLPPTTPPATRVEVARAPAQDVEVRDVPTLATAQPTAAPEGLRVEVIRRSAPSPAIETRDVPVLERAPVATAQVTPSVQVARSASSAPSVDVRDVPLAASSAAAASAAAATNPANSSLSSSTTVPASSASAAGRSTASAAAGPAIATPSTGVGTGPKAAPAPGSWATSRRADDWGESARNKPGNALYDSTGRPRLADGPGSASAPHPPGMITDEIRDLDRAGTWLKRKPFPYEPTRWDRLWRPNETLLQEWVEKGVKQVGIPVPGTSKTITCVISILQLGGGCGIEDPNMRDQPAIARPPPDVPFKPQLQEGNGATWDPNGKPTKTPPLPGLFAPPKSGTSDGGSD